MSAINPSYFYWIVALVVSIPLIVLFLNESIDRSRRRGGPYEHVLSFFRDIILPLFVLTIMLRYIFVVSDQNVPAKLISTAFWLVSIVAIVRLSRNIIGTGTYAADDWRSLVPHMFLRLPPYAIIGFVIYHIIQNLWSFPVREMATTLGIGSIVIAFALQDTLSNLVSGVLLVANSPFKTGDWVRVGDTEGQIGAVNWRYTHILTVSYDLVVIPNGSIAGESIKNYSRPKRSTSVIQDILISYQHPPNEVRAILTEVIKNTDGVLDEPEPYVDLITLDDPSMKYTFEYWVEDFGQKTTVHAELMSHLWYALQRHSIALPTTLYEVKNYSGVNHETGQERQALNLKSCLNWLPHFSKLPIATRNRLAEISSFQLYAQNETVLQKYAKEPGLFIVVNGSVSVENSSQSNEESTKKMLHSGEFFGETGLFGRGVSPAMFTAAEDSQILCIPHDDINDTINRNPEFAHSISTVIDQRRTMNKLSLVKPVQTSVGATPPKLEETTEE